MKREAESMRVMVATDGSPAGAAALKFGARLARLDPAVALTIVTVSPEHPQPDENAQAKEILTSAAKALSRERVHGVVRVVARRESETVPDAISRHADRLRSDLVVVGSEGRDTMSEWVVGGVALRLIYVASRPVLVVRAPRRRRA